MQDAILFDRTLKRIFATGSLPQRTQNSLRRLETADLEN